jgi:hypothetical protein
VVCGRRVEQHPGKRLAAGAVTPELFDGCVWMMWTYSPVIEDEPIISEEFEHLLVNELLFIERDEPLGCGWLIGNTNEQKASIAEPSHCLGRTTNKRNVDDAQGTLEFSSYGIRVQLAHDPVTIEKYR